MTTQEPPVTRVIHIASLPQGWHTNPQYADYLYIGRRNECLNAPGTYGNEFVVGKSYPEFGLVRATNAEVCRLYEEQQLLPRLATDLDFRTAIMHMHGKVLVCYCKAYLHPVTGKLMGCDKPCHGDVLAAYTRRLYTQAEKLPHG